ncbi:MAG TPA: hypothetical protein VNM70_12345 [Burkholderiales bacterium]|jgi:hypothetical protein|nr:hypothetical protein [Burkholderiales bacterium]
MEWLLTREVVVGLAVLGALPSVAASVLAARGGISPARARQLNLVGYSLMGISMLLFITVGFRSH